MTDAKEQKAPVILIVGGSFGGLGCATKLVELAKGADITIVDSSEQFTIGGMWQFVWSGRNKMEDCVWKLSDLSLPGVSVKTKTTVQSLDLPNNSVTFTDNTKQSYDYLVLSPGVVCDGSNIPGLSENAFNVCSQQQSTEFAKKLDDFAENKGDKTVLITIAGVPYKCPPVPFEFAFLIDEILKEKGVRDATTIKIACPVEWPFGGPPAKKVFTETMAERKIEYLAQHQLTKVADNTAHFKTKDATAEIPFDLLVSTFPQKAPKFVADAIKCNPKGKVPINIVTNQPTTCEQKNVFVVGDAAFAFMPAVEKPQPSAGEIGFQMGEATGAIIAARLKGEKDPAPPERTGKCFAEAGEKGAGIIIDANFSNVLADTATGKPVMKCSYLASPSGEKAKIDWFNAYLVKLFGDKVRQFKSG